MNENEGKRGNETRRIMERKYHSTREREREREHFNEKGE
jgi:hypothetical protein